MRRCVAAFWAGLKRWLKGFWRQLINGFVEPFVWIYYIALLWWGIKATVRPQPDSYVAQSLGNLYGPWVWVQIPATLAVMAGLLMHWFKPSLDQQADRPDLWVQFSGHSCMFFVLLAYEAVEWPVQDFSFFAIAPYVLGCLFLMLLTGHGAITARRRRQR